MVTVVLHVRLAVKYLILKLLDDTLSGIIILTIEDNYLRDFVLK